MKLNLLFCLLALTLCGCEHTLTYKAWHSTEVTHFQPASDPKLQLWERAAPSSDILVVYQELAERTGRERPRAFFLRANEERLARGRKPVFADPNIATGLRPILVLPSAGRSRRVWPVRLVHARPADA